ncbi:hypothetical protein SAMN06265222_1413 [Neorhodopirellula lusitana]|uniref:Secreted protein n=1 Tax=Neorhodopirellula lusitana TaxID=445327 RepID=A0ABY1QWV6_9BACT|nr:hypothetical protein SAMN06265222_1413 [Neorhodopirellula lusitana]
MACTGVGLAAVFKWLLLHSRPGDAGRYPTEIMLCLQKRPTHLIRRPGLMTLAVSRVIVRQMLVWSLLFAFSRPL